MPRNAPFGFANLIAPVLDAQARRVDDYRATRDRYAAALNFAATCAPVHRPRAMQAVARAAADHRVNVSRLHLLDPGTSDPRD